MNLTARLHACRDEHDFEIAISIHCARFPRHAAEGRFKAGGCGEVPCVCCAFVFKRFVFDPIALVCAAGEVVVEAGGEAGLCAEGEAEYGVPFVCSCSFGDG